MAQNTIDITRIYSLKLEPPLVSKSQATSHSTIMFFPCYTESCGKATQEVKHIAQVQIECSLYKGDALSPLPFCIGLNPLGQESPAKTGCVYRLQNGATISHLLFMDDNKLYAKSETSTHWSHHQDLQQWYQNDVLTPQVQQNGIHRVKGSQTWKS